MRRILSIAICILLLLNCFALSEGDVGAGGEAARRTSLWRRATSTRSRSVMTGTLWAWGVGEYGRLGTGGSSYLSIYDAKPVELENVVQASAGWYHSLFLTSDGDVYAAGCNYELRPARQLATAWITACPFACWKTLCRWRRGAISPRRCSPTARCGPGGATTWPARPRPYGRADHARACRASRRCGDRQGRELPARPRRAGGELYGWATTSTRRWTIRATPPSPSRAGSRRAALCASRPETRTPWR